MKKLILTAFSLVLVLSACELTDLNENTKDPNEVPADPLFSNSQVAMGTFLHLTNVNNNIFKLMAQHWTTTTYDTEPKYEITKRNIPDNVWILLYRDVLADLKKAKEKIEANKFLKSGEKSNKLASIEVLNVLAYSSLVNIFGNIPYTEALDPENTQPSFDVDQTIYADLISRLNNALSSFDPSAQGFGSADVFYNGDIGKWIKFANSLKLRLAITIADANETAARKAIEEAAGNAFTSNADNALIPFKTSSPNTNPVWEALVQSGRNDYLPANSLVELMNSTEDPRRAVFFTKIDGKYLGGIYGVSNDYGSYSHFSEIVKKKDRPGMILGYDEVEFILAEAVARGFNVSGTVASHYKKGVRADMEYWDIPDSKIASYLSQKNVSFSTAAGTDIEKIARQKYYALFLQGLQAWTEVRRLDTPKLDAPEGAVVDELPSRFTYPSDEEILNQESYNAAVAEMGGDKLTTKIFWDIK